MSTYVKNDKALEYDNAPDWLVAYMRYRRIMMGHSPNSIMTYFITLREFLQWFRYYHKYRKSPETEETLRSIDLLDMEISEALTVKRADVETYLYFCADSLNNRSITRRKKLISIRCFYNYVLDQNDVLHTTLEYNPADRIVTPKTPKKQPIYLPEDDRTSLLSNIDGYNAPRDYAILMLMITCGLRVSEIVSMTMKDVNLNARTIKIHGKGNKERLAHPTEACVDALQRYLDEYRCLTEADKSLNAPFFISKRTNQRLTTRSVERLMQKHVNTAGIGGMGYTPHKLRHTTATILAKDGVDLLMIQQILGHESPTTTQLYTHLGKEDLELAVSQSSLSKIGQ